MLLLLLLEKSNPNANINVRPQALAILTPHARIPLDKLVQRDLVLGRQGRARVPALDEGELLAVVDHARLGGSGCRNAIALCRSGRRLFSGRSRFGGTSPSPNDAHTRIGVGPQPRTVALGGGVPLLELGDRDGVLGGDDGAGLARLDEVELVAVGCHAGLGREGCEF